MSSQPFEPLPFDQQRPARPRRPLHVVPSPVLVVKAAHEQPQPSDPQPTKSGPSQPQPTQPESTPKQPERGAAASMLGNTALGNTTEETNASTAGEKTPVVRPAGATPLAPIAPPTPGGGLPTTDATGKPPQTAAVTVLPPPRNLAHKPAEPKQGKAVPAPIVAPAPISQPIPATEMATPVPAKFQAPRVESLTLAPETADMPYTEATDSATAKPTTGPARAATSPTPESRAAAIRRDAASALTTRTDDAETESSSSKPQKADAPAGIAAIIGHSTALVTAFLTWGLLPFAGPLVLWFVYRDSHPRLRNAAARTFNFTLLVAFAGWALLLLAFLAGASTGQPWLFWFFGLPTVVVLWGAGVALPIWGIVQERRGETFDYPLNPGWIS